MNCSNNPGEDAQKQGLSPELACKHEERANISAVLGIFSLFFWPLSIISGLIAVIMGTKARKVLPAAVGSGRSRALIGIVTGATGLALGILVIAFIVWALHFLRIW